MRLRRAVPKILGRPSVPPRLPLYKSHRLPTRSESTLLQVLIPLHFNSPRINTYAKQGGGCPSFIPKVLQLVTTHASPNWSRRNARNSNLSIRFRTLTVTHGVCPVSHRSATSIPCLPSTTSFRAKRGISLPPYLLTSLLPVLPRPLRIHTSPSRSLISGWRAFPLQSARPVRVGPSLSLHAARQRMAR
jgi:hypothetical protein